MPHGNQRVDELDRCLCRLRAQQADAEADRRQAVELGGGEPVVNGVDHLAQASVPGRPVGGIDDHVGIAGAAGGETSAEPIAQLSQALPRRSQCTGPVEKVKKVGQAFELQQTM